MSSSHVVTSRPRPRLVSRAVLEQARTPTAGVVLGAGEWGCHLGLPGGVVSVGVRGAPLLANGVGLRGTRWPGVPPPPGSAVRLGPAGLWVGGLRLRLDVPEAAWDPRVPALPADAATRAALAGRLADAAPVGALAVACGRVGAGALADLAQGLAARDPLRVAAAAAGLVGRGPGLTPEGDDLLAGAAAGAHAAGASVLAAALCPADVGALTTALAATLLRLAACEGAAPEPVHRLLTPGGLAGALCDLGRLGHSTGRAYAAGVALAVGALAEE